MAGTIGSTFSIFYPAAGVDAGSVDCRLERTGVAEAWGDIRAAGGGQGASDTSTNGGLYANDNGSSWTELMRSFHDFAIAATIGTDTIISATSSTYDAGTFNDNATHNFGKVVAVGGALDDAEQDNCGTGNDYGTQTGTALASDTVTDLGARTASVYLHLQLNAAGLSELTSAISGSRPARLVYLFNKDQSNTAPSLGTGDSYWYHFHADQAGATDPKLTIEHEAAAVSATLPNPIIFFE